MIYVVRVGITSMRLLFVLDTINLLTQRGEESLAQKEKENVKHGWYKLSWLDIIRFFFFEGTREEDWGRVESWIFSYF